MSQVMYVKVKGKIAYFTFSKKHQILAAPKRTSAASVRAFLLNVAFLMCTHISFLQFVSLANVSFRCTMSIT